MGDPASKNKEENNNKKTKPVWRVQKAPDFDFDHCFLYRLDMCMYSTHIPHIQMNIPYVYKNRKNIETQIHP